MEYLQVNEGSGQAYGYVLYRTTIPSTSSKISITKLRDHGVVRSNRLLLSDHLMVYGLFLFRL